MIRKGFSWTVVAAGCLATAASAHHSAAMFDASKTLLLSGTVTEWQFANPHSWLIVLIRDDTGKDTIWRFETGAPTTLIRAGVTRLSFAAGDKVKVSSHPLKDGTSGGSLVSVTKADGSVVRVIG